jgi:rod shape-determining protein MreD
LADSLLGSSALSLLAVVFLGQSLNRLVVKNLFLFRIFVIFLATFLGEGIFFLVSLLGKNSFSFSQVFWVSLTNVFFGLFLFPFFRFCFRVKE